tara:strand:+ start:2559 stop:2984 length:426 start_codon:yes stop_codon:yes gene_type:complete
MHIVVTEVDAVTKIPCTVEPQRTGPSMPNVKGLQIIWQDKSTWPVSTDSTGTYLRAPKYYGTCDADADLNIAGVLEVLSETEWNERRVAEHNATKPYPSWIGYLDTMSWSAPVARPVDAVMNGGNVRYQWDEATVNWIPAA